MNSSTLRMTLSMSLALLLIFQPCVLPSAFAAPPPAPVNTGAPPVAEGVAAKSKAADAGEAAEFISLERLCCPFLGFALVVEAEGGSAWLRLTGREGVKAFIREEVSGLLGGAIDRAGIK